MPDDIGRCPGCTLIHRNPRPDCNGWRPPTCRCGHTMGDHGSAGRVPLAFSKPQGGICYVDGCGCKRFERAAAT